MGEFVNFASGTITDNPLTVGATSVNSAAFATVLPVIAAPHTMSIVLDPEGDDGVPEIVVVTAHAASATVATITRGQQTSIGGSTARSHVAGTAWVLAATALDLNRASGDPGDLKAGIWSSPPAGWLLMGQTITAADTTYPALWAVVPAAWKSGTTLTLPSMDGRAMLGGGTIGAIGGANTHTLAEVNLPAHTHAIDHNHASVTSSGISVDHAHIISHGHTASASTTGSTTSDGSHSHTVQSAIRPTGPGAFHSFMSAGAGTGSTITDNPTIDAAGAHSHTLSASTTVTVDAHSGYSGGVTTDHSHNVDLPIFTGLSGSTGSGTAVDHTPSHLRINVAIKT